MWPSSLPARCSKSQAGDETLMDDSNASDRKRWIFKLLEVSNGCVRALTPARDALRYWQVCPFCANASACYADLNVTIKAALIC